jgi:hypothetical protein
MYTKGEWKALQGITNKDWWIQGPWNSDDGHREITSLNPTYGNGKANALLIAASPYLLAACKALLEMITDNRLHGPEVYNAAQAIHKAEGRE